MFRKKQKDEAPKPLMTIQGSDGDVELYPTRIRLRQHGMLSRVNKGLVGDKDILLTSLTGVQIKKPGKLTKGYIQFIYMGSQDKKSGVFGAVKDENTIMIGGKKEYQQCLQLREEVERLQTAARQAPIQVQATSMADELSKLADLRDRGVISKKQFEQQRDKLLKP